MPYREDRPLSSLFRDEEVLDVAREITEAVGRRLLEVVMDYTPVAEDSFGERARAPGSLRRSWRSGDVRVDGRVFTVEISTDDPIAPMVEWPTRPHLIKPSASKEAIAEAKFRAKHPGSTANGPFARLRFRDRSGQVIYATMVHHPGTHGAYMMTRALATIDEEWPLIAQRVIRGRR